jgi:hypothetical protein
MARQCVITPDPARHTERAAGERQRSPSWSFHCSSEAITPDPGRHIERAAGERQRRHTEVLSTSSTTADRCILSGIVPGCGAATASAEDSRSNSNRRHFATSERPTSLVPDGVRCSKRDGSRGRRGFSPMPSHNPLMVGVLPRDHRPSRKSATSYRTRSRSSSCDSSIDPKSRHLVAALFDTSAQTPRSAASATPRREDVRDLTASPTLRPDMSSSGVASCLKADSEFRNLGDLMQHKSHSRVDQQSHGVSSFFDNEPPPSSTGGVRRCPDSRQTFPSSCMLSGETVASPVSASLSQAYQTSSGFPVWDVSSSSRRGFSGQRAADEKTPWALHSGNDETASSSSKQDDIYIQMPAPGTSASGFRVPVRSGSVKTGFGRNESGGRLEDGFSRQTPEHAHEKALMSMQKLARRSPRAIEAGSGATAPWTKASGDDNTMSSPPPRSIEAGPFALGEGSDVASPEIITVESDMQRKYRQSPQAMSPQPAPYALSETILSPSSAQNKDENELRIWVTNCMASHVKSACEAEAQLRRESRPSRRASSGTPRRRRQSKFGQDAPAAKLGAAPGSEQQQSSRFRYTAAASNGAASSSAYCHPLRSGSATLRKSRQSLASSSSLKAYSRSSSCDSLNFRDGLLAHGAGPRFAKELQASHDVLPGLFTGATDFWEAGGPDCGAGPGESIGSSVAISKSASTSRVKAALLADSSSTRSLNEVLQQSCAERIQQLKSDARRLDCKRMVSQRMIEDALPHKARLNHSASHGTTRIDSEIGTSRAHSELSLFLDGDHL